MNFHLLFVYVLFQSLACALAFHHPLKVSSPTTIARPPSMQSRRTTRLRVGQEPADKTFQPNGVINAEQNKISLAGLSGDLAKLEKIRPPVPSADFSSPLTIISAGSSYTRLWTAETWKAHSKEPQARYVRHVLKWPASTTARKILPMVMISVAWSLLLSIAANTLKPLKALLDVTGPSSALSYLSAPLALLLTLRANASMSRIVEARLLWGRLVLHVRGLAGLVNIYLMPHEPSVVILLARHLAVLGWILKSSVRGESIEREKEVLGVMLGHSSASYEWIVEQPKRTTALLARVRQLAATAFSSSPDTARMSSVLLLIEERIAELELCVGGCDRLFTSPIPPTYSRHLSRVMFLWLLLLPMSLAALNLCTLGIVLPTAVATYVLVGIDEVGMEIENAFQLLPLQQLAAAAQNGVRDQFFPVGGPMPSSRS